MPPASITTLFLLQAGLNLCIVLYFRKTVPLAINVVGFSLLTTVPMIVYAPLGPSGMIFIIDLLIPATFLYRLLSGVPIRAPLSLRMGLFLFGLPALYAPIGLLLTPVETFSFHTFQLFSYLYRSLVIVGALALFEDSFDLKVLGPSVSLFASLFFVLFGFGVVQYGMGVDLVIFERVLEAHDSATPTSERSFKVLFGSGFLGLFRGAVAQMAVIGLIWVLIQSKALRVNRLSSLRFDLFVGAAFFSVLASLSRAGTFAVLGALTIILTTNMRGWVRIPAYLIGALLVTTTTTITTEISELLPILIERFDLTQLLGIQGSGATRRDAITGITSELAGNWRIWLFGYGGFNPLALHEAYGVHGMHNGYFDLVARYGLIPAVIILTWFLWRAIGAASSCFSRSKVKSTLGLAFIPLVAALVVLSISQETITFYGSAGYLATVNLWVQLLFFFLVFDHQNTQNVDWRFGAREK